MTSRFVITKDDVKRLLVERRLCTHDQDLADDAEIALDSMSLTWFVHALEQEYGIVVAPSDDDIDELTSIDAIHRYVQRATSGGGSGRNGA